MKRFVCIVVVLLLVLTCFCACSAGVKTEDAGMYDMGYTQNASDAMYGIVEQSKESVADAPVQGIQNQKLIRSMTVEAETADMDALLTALDAKISSLGGYVENQSVRNGGNTSSRRYRYADLTIRIPASHLDEFFEHVSGYSNVIYFQENADDVTLNYVATQSRITALETEQARLLELLAKAENMADLLQIEQRLTDVRTELEKVTSQLRLYDNLVDYGTLKLTVTEVREFTVVEEETVWQRIRGGLAESLDSIGTFLVDSFVFLVVGLPYWIPVGVAVFLLVLAVRHARKKRMKGKEEPTQNS